MRTHSPRRLAALVAPLLLAASLTACGGGADSAPEDASKEDFCKVWNEDDDEDVFDSEASPEEQAEKFKDQLDTYVDDLEETGTPEDIPGDAREGFEIFSEAAGDVSEDDIKKLLEDPTTDILTDGLDGEEKKKVESFTTWANDYCG